MGKYIVKNDYNDLTLGTIKINNINFQKVSDLMDFGWKLVHISHERSLSDDSFPRFKESTYVYRNNSDFTKGLRLYEDYVDYQYTFHMDHRMISKLQEKQPNIKLTEFPTGIVTIEDKVIGQQIPYYDGYIKINEILKEGISEEQFYDYIRKIIDIFKELVDNNIIYMDIHFGNILINPLDEDIKLIDFEKEYIHIDNNTSYGLKEYLEMLKRLKNLFIKLSEYGEFDFININKNFNSIDELYQIIPEKGKSLIKR